MDDDPTLVRNQPALTTSTGRIWLILGGIFTAIALAMLIPLNALQPVGLGLAAAIVDALLYAGMVVARLALPPGRGRLQLMAVGMLAIAMVSLVSVIVIAWNAA